MRLERKTDERPTKKNSLETRRLYEEAGVVVTNRDCLLKSKKKEVSGSSSGEISTFASVYLMVLA